jgi:hypothetical protein
MFSLLMGRKGAETCRSGIFLNTVKPGYNDIGLYDTSPTASDILWYQLIPHC